MDVDRARTFLEIVPLGSFLKAAERLNVSQTTVSARIRTLEEEELGRALFVAPRPQRRPLNSRRRRVRALCSQLRPGLGAGPPARALALPPGKRAAVVGIGAELSLWSPLLVDWMAALKAEAPELAIHPMSARRRSSRRTSIPARSTLPSSTRRSSRRASSSSARADDQLVQVAPGAAPERPPRRRSSSTGDRLSLCCTARRGFMQPPVSSTSDRSGSPTCTAPAGAAISAAPWWPR